MIVVYLKGDTFKKKPPLWQERIPVPKLSSSAWRLEYSNEEWDFWLMSPKLGPKKKLDFYCPSKRVQSHPFFAIIWVSVTNYCLFYMSVEISWFFLCLSNFMWNQLFAHQKIFREINSIGVICKPLISRNFWQITQIYSHTL